MAVINFEIIAVPSIPETLRKIGTATFDVISEKFVIKIGDEKLFEEKPDNGKKWSVSMVLNIAETNI